eukprot:812813-Pelagomonas_calceolata.AAC.8
MGHKERTCNPLPMSEHLLLITHQALLPGANFHALHYRLASSLHALCASATSSKALEEIFRADISLYYPAAM